MDYERTLVMACQTVIEEMLPLMPPGMHRQVLDFGLHVQPDKLREVLQAAIDAVDDNIETILLGYGLCSRAVVGISSPKFRLVVPRVDDCIAIFLGSKAAYNTQSRCEPGTYYLTKGWIEVGSTPFTEYDEMVKRMGPEKAERIQKIMLRNYKRLALINTGQYGMDKYREYARQTAERFGLRYEEIPGSNAMVKKMLEGNWDEEFVVVEPGETISMEHFFKAD
jgi:hypothetical protein